MSVLHLLARALASGAGLSACASSLSVPDIDALARQSEARTILLEDGFSLWSPYELAATREHLEVVRAQRDRVFTLLGVPDGPPIVVWLRPHEGMTVGVSFDGEGLRVDSLASGPSDHVLGQADATLVQIRVGAPADLELADGRVLTTAYGPEAYADTVCHELVHVAMARLGVAGEDWLDEGFAHALEWIPVADGRFVTTGQQPYLDAVARLSAERRTVDAFLDWTQTFPVREEDGAARLLALSFVVFFCERAALGVREGLLRLAALTPAEVRALEPTWTAWLERFG